MAGHLRRPKHDGDVVVAASHEIQQSVHGREGVASWHDSDNIGRQSHFDVHGIRPGRKHEQYLLTVTVSGNGYNGPGTFTFDLRDGLIARFLIA